MAAVKQNYKRVAGLVAIGLGSEEVVVEAIC